MLHACMSCFWIFRVFTLSRQDFRDLITLKERLRWYAHICRLPLGEAALPLVIEVERRFKLVEQPVPVLWPWDMLQWWDSINGLEAWVSNEPEKASQNCRDPRMYKSNISFYRMWTCLQVLFLALPLSLDLASFLSGLLVSFTG